MMARTSLKDINLAERIKQASRSGGNPIVIQNSQGVTATLYAGATGSTTMTNSQAVTGLNFTGGLDGYLDPGSYQIACGGAVTQAFDVAGTPSDDLLSVSNARPRFAVPSVAATTTSQTLKFVRIVPDKKITAVSVVIYSGTAVAA